MQVSPMANVFGILQGIRINIIWNRIADNSSSIQIFIAQFEVIGYYKFAEGKFCTQSNVIHIRIFILCYVMSFGMQRVRPYGFQFPVEQVTAPINNPGQGNYGFSEI